MRRLKLVSMLGLTLGALALLAACGQGGAQNAPAGPGLTARTVSAGGVEVTITPIRIDSTGAVFEVAFDTHSGDLALDVAKASELQVDGTKAKCWSADFRVVTQGSELRVRQWALPSRRCAPQHRGPSWVGGGDVDTRILMKGGR